MSQSKKSKTSHSEEGLNAHLRQRSDHQVQQPYAMASQGHNTQTGAGLEVSTNYPTPISPPSDQIKDVGEDLIYGTGAAWTKEKERILLGPYDYLYGHPGKDIRSQCIAAFNLWLKVPPERLEVITGVVGMLHTASLLYAHIFFLAPERQYLENYVTNLCV
jgi:geranylgeranyl diphosphate synthase type 3